MSREEAQKQYRCTFSVDASLVRTIEADSYRDAVAKAVAMKNNQCLAELDEAIIRGLEHAAEIRND